MVRRRGGEFLRFERTYSKARATDARKVVSKSMALISGSFALPVELVRAGSVSVDVRGRHTECGHGVGEIGEPEPRDDFDVPGRHAGKAP